MKEMDKSRTYDAFKLVCRVSCVNTGFKCAATYVVLHDYYKYAKYLMARIARSKYVLPSSILGYYLPSTCKSNSRHN